MGTPAELPQPRQPVQVLRVRPHPKPAVALWGEPPSGPRRRLVAVGGLKLVAVDHLPTSTRLRDEAWARVAWFRHAVHGTTVDPRPLSPVARNKLDPDQGRACNGTPEGRVRSLVVDHRGNSPLRRLRDGCDKPRHRHTRR